jgi:hypothetical protein
MPIVPVHPSAPRRTCLHAIRPSPALSGPETFEVLETSRTFAERFHRCGGSAVDESARVRGQVRIQKRMMPIANLIR